MDSGPSVFRSAYRAAFAGSAKIAVALAAGLLILADIVLIRAGFPPIALQSLLLPFAVATLFLLGAIWVLIRIFRTKVHDWGIAAFDYWGIPHAVRWSDMVFVDTQCFAGLMFIRVFAGKRIASLYLPMFHSHQDEFLAEVLRRAPDGCPLSRFLVGLRA